jgi:hypothetical protein
MSSADFWLSLPAATSARAKPGNAMTDVSLGGDSTTAIGGVGAQELQQIDLR